MKIIIKHKQSKVIVEIDYKHDSYVDVRELILKTITQTIDKLNEDKKR